MPDFSILIPARKEEWLARTVEDILSNKRGDTEIIVVVQEQPAKPPVPQHPDVTLIYCKDPIGQRAGTNMAARVARGKYVMKCDAHCAFDEGFDVKLMEEFEYDWTVIPRMYNLHVFDWLCLDCQARLYQGPQPPKCGQCGSRRLQKDLVWKPRWNRKTDFARFDSDLRFQYWEKYRKRPEAKGEIADTMCHIGACWAMHRDRYFELGGTDEKHGSWGQMGVEISCKTWLSGGRQVVNKRTWFAHMFRTQKGFTFPYRNDGIERARWYSRELWRKGKWPKAKHDLSWLVEKFAPVPDWPTNGPAKGLVYYTDDHADAAILEMCRKQILRCMQEYGYPIVSVSQKPLDFGTNHVLPIGRSVLSIFKQILKGVEECDAEIIFLLEHDILYHPSHFDFTPDGDDIFWYDRNKWSVCPDTGKAVFYHTNVPSMLCAPRTLLLEHYRRRVELTEKHGFKSSQGYSPPKGLPKNERKRYRTYFSRYPCVDIRHGSTFTRKRMDPSQFRSERSRRGWTESDEVPGWGKVKDFLGGIHATQRKQDVEEKV